MAEIVCPHCHSSVPRDGAFCAGCGSYVGSGDPERVHAYATTAERDAQFDPELPAELGLLVEPPAAVHRPDPPRSRPGTNGDPPWRERAYGDPPARRRRRVPLPRLGSLGSLARRARCGARRLGALPVGVGVVVLGLLASGGVLYGLGAFAGDAGAKRATVPPRLVTPAKVSVSCAAPPSVDGAGDKVTFGRRHLVDGDTATAWRCFGTGHGQRATLRFDRPVRVTRLALVPGWATRDAASGANRFTQNGAPRTVTWILGGRHVPQRLGKPRPGWSSVDLAAPVTVRKVTLRVGDVRNGRSRNTVAVSEIRVYALAADSSS